MAIFFIALGCLIGLAIYLLFIVLRNIKMVGGNELGIKTNSSKAGFISITGGRFVVIPLINKYDKLSLTPHTVEVVVGSAISAGIIPLNVKATVSFAVSSSSEGRRMAASRVLRLYKNSNKIDIVASSIIEGHLRDAIASLTPEQVMTDKALLISKMINACKSDLENIGIEITTMNIADVDDNKIGDLAQSDHYIALLKRVQTAKAGAEAISARSESEAISFEQQQARRAEVEIRALENAKLDLEANLERELREQSQIEAVGISQAIQNGKATVSSIKGEILAEQKKIEQLTIKYKSDIEVPALAQKEAIILKTKEDIAQYLAESKSELIQLAKTINLVKSGNRDGKNAYILENFNKIFAPFAKTMELFPTGSIQVLSGANETNDNFKPISSVHPHAMAEEKNNIIVSAMQNAGIDPANLDPNLNQTGDNSIQSIVSNTNS